MSLTLIQSIAQAGNHVHLRLRARYQRVAKGVQRKVLEIKLKNLVNQQRDVDYQLTLVRGQMVLAERMHEIICRELAEKRTAIRTKLVRL